MDEDLLPLVADALHAKLSPCGAFVWHESRDDAFAALQRLAAPVALALAPAYTIDDHVSVRAWLPKLEESRVLATIRALSDFPNRLYDSTHGVAASDWLFRTWKELAGGRASVEVEQIDHRSWPQRPVRLRLPGGSNAAETVVLGAHLDSFAPGPSESARAPGADDDASGLAALTEVIRVLVASEYVPRRTLEFIAYAAEEVGLQGSKRIAKQYADERRAIVGVLQLDMIAYQGDERDIWLHVDHASEAQSRFLVELVAAYLPDLTVAETACGYPCSDHAAWKRYGFPASLAFEASLMKSNRTRHTEHDTTTAFRDSAAHAIKFTKLALAYAVELGSDGPALEESGPPSGR
jgi:leucyl aminopeptidase